MNVDELLTGARDAMRASIVFGEPVERDGMTVIPAAKVRGGAGGGGDAENNGGAGFGLTARPAGAYVIRGGTVEWQPAIDVNRIVLGGQLVAIAALLVLRTWIKSRR
ncbi:MAG: sporulation protein [Chloroflexota bacterium]